MAKPLRPRNPLPKTPAKPVHSRPNPLERPVLTFAKLDRPDPLKRPVLSFISPIDLSPQVQMLDLTTHALHGEHLESVLAHAKTLAWAPGAVLKARVADAKVASRLQADLKASLGTGAPRVVVTRGGGAD